MGRHERNRIVEMIGKYRFVFVAVFEIYVKSGIEINQLSVKV